ncbi:MAG: acyl-CoA dehydrogenase family protein [Smithella sp.]
MPKENVIAKPGEGFVLAMKAFAHSRPMIGAFAVGVARSAMDYAIHYAKSRRAFGHHLQSYEAIQFKIAEMYQKVETSRLLVMKAAWEADNGIDPTLSASISKFYCTEAANEVVNEALQIAGGYGYTKLYTFEKLLCDARLLMIYEGTSEIQRIIVSGYALGVYQPIMPPIEDLPMLRSETGGKDFEKEMSGKTAWRCRMCGHIHYGNEPPDECPYCFFPGNAFKKIWPRESRVTNHRKWRSVQLLMDHLQINYGECYEWRGMSHKSCKGFGHRGMLCQPRHDGTASCGCS